MPGIRDLLAQRGLGANAIDRVVVDRGPGLFTGLRVGIATAVGFALAANCELVGVTSLEVLPRARIGRRSRDAARAPSTDGGARSSSSRFELADVVTPTSEPAVARPADVSGQLGDLERADTLPATARRATPATSRRSRTSSHLRTAGALAPRGASHSARRVDPRASITPLYLREPDAVANFSTRERSS